MPHRAALRGEYKADFCSCNLGDAQGGALFGQSVMLFTVSKDSVVYIDERVEVINRFRRAFRAYPDVRFARVSFKGNVGC